MCSVWRQSSTGAHVGWALAVRRSAPSEVNLPSEQRVAMRGATRWGEHVVCNDACALCTRLGVRAGRGTSTSSSHLLRSYHVAHEEGMCVRVLEVFWNEIPTQTYQTFDIFICNYYSINGDKKDVLAHRLNIISTFLTYASHLAHPDPPISASCRTPSQICHT